MSDKIFVNTNILIYCRDASEKLKQPVAKKCIEKLWFDHTGVISTQVKYWDSHHTNFVNFLFL
jgi:predicted nucleic acid-binding protein